jgi:hypothetical protein
MGIVTGLKAAGIAVALVFATAAGAQTSNGVNSSGPVMPNQPITGGAAALPNSTEQATLQRNNAANGSTSNGAGTTGASSASAGIHSRGLMGANGGTNGGATAGTGAGAGAAGAGSGTEHSSQ